MVIDEDGVPEPPGCPDQRRTQMVATTFSRSSPAVLTASPAEADGNRTRQRRCAPLTGFEDRSRRLKAAEAGEASAVCAGQRGSGAQGGRARRNPAKAVSFQQ